MTRKVSLEVVYTILGQLSQVGSMVIGAFLITQAIGLPEYGNIAIALTFVLIGNQVIYGPLSNAATRFHFESESNLQLDIHTLACKRILLLTIIPTITISTIVFAACIYIGSGIDIATAACATTYTLSSGYFSVFTALLNAARKRRRYAATISIESWGRLAVALLAIHFSHSSAAIVLASYTLWTTLIVAVLWISTKNQTDPILDKVLLSTHITRILKFAAPFSIHGPFTWAQLSLDRWSLGRFHTNLEIGTYALIYQFGFFPMNLLGTIVNQHFTPLAYEAHGKSYREVLGRKIDSGEYFILIATASVLAASAIVVTTIWIISEIATPILPHQFAQQMVNLAVLATAGGVFASTQTLSMIYSIRHNLRKLTAIKIITSIIAVAMFYYGSMMSGIRGVAVALLIFNITLLLTIATDLMNHSKRKQICSKV